MIKKGINLLRGFLILMGFYFISVGIIKITNINFPPVILGLVLFALSLIKGIIKEDWVKDISHLFINNMAMFLLPFWAGLIVYKTMLTQNLLAIALVIIVTTTITITATGLFVDYGLKFARLKKMRASKHD